MKKFTLFAAAAIVALTASAKGDALSIKSAVAMNGEASVKKIEAGATLKATTKSDFNITREGRKATKAITPKADDATPTVITEQPEGELVQYERDGFNWVYSNGISRYLQAGITDVVYSEDDNRVWLKDPLSFISNGAWIEGEAVDGGSTLKFRTGQFLSWNESEQYGICVGFYVPNQSPTTVASIAALDTEEEYITFTIDGNVIKPSGALAAKDAATNNYGMPTEGKMLGGYWNDDLSPVGYYFDWGTTLTEYVAPTDPIVVLPDGLETEEFNLTGNTDSGALSQKINVAFDGSDVYIQDFSGFFPEGWIKGTIGEDGTTVKFGPQYLGLYMDKHVMYLVGATYDQSAGSLLLTEDSGFEFEYDAEARTLSQTTGYILVNGSKDDLGYYAYAYDLFISNEGPATPAAPTILSWTAYDEATGSGSMTVQMPIIDTEGNALLIQKLQYKLYSDIERDTTAVTAGFTLSNVEQFDNTSLKLTFTTDATTVDFNNVGFSAIYNGGLESHESEIAWYHIKDYAPTATVGDLNNDGSIDGNDVSALLEMVLAGGVSDEQMGAADVTGDGSVDGNDVSALLEVVLAGGGSGE